MARKVINVKENKSGFRAYRRVNKKRLVIMLGIALIAYFIYQSYKNRNTIVTSTTNAQRLDLVESVSAAGRISAEKRVDLNFQTTGAVELVNFVEGDFVQQGQTIARLDTTNLYQAYLQADANLRKADATLERVYDQIQGSEDNESFAQRELRTDAETARDVAYRAFVTAQNNLANATIRAPFSGMIASVAEGLAPGYVVSPATPPIILVDPSTATFEANVNESNISKIYLGQKVNITLDAYQDEEFVGEVTKIGFSAISTSTGGTAYPVQISIPGNIGLKFKIGMNGDAEFVLESKQDVLTIPITAVVEEEDSTYVWISENGVAKKVEVKTGITSVNEIEIVEGLPENQTIIIRPPNGIEEGKRIVEVNEN